MNKTEREYFLALHKDRKESADNFEKPSNRGYWRSLVDKYSDQAHFIYELIQNADDVNATSARFVLYSDRLIFAHNGSRHFSISDPANEEIDSQEGRLGDINSITLGLYEKSIIADLSYNYADGTMVEKICIQQNRGEDIIAQNMWLFTRKLDRLKYSVGYFLDDNDQLKPVTEPAFCYFPTKESTGLKFIVHLSVIIRICS